MRGVRIEDDVPGAPGGVVSLTAFHCTLTLIGRRQGDLRKSAHARPAARYGHGQTVNAPRLIAQYQ